MTTPPEEVRFAKNAVIMADAIYTGVDKLYKLGYKTVDPGVVSMARELIKVIDPHKLIQGFIQNSHTECWDKIKERNEEFFLNNVSSIFCDLPMDIVILFKDLFLTKDAEGHNVVSQDLKDSIWGLLDAMIKISIRYTHKHKIEEVNLEYHVKVWKIQL